MKILIVGFGFSLSLLCSAATQEIATSMVPRSRFVEQTGRDYQVKTQAGTKVQIEFKRDGTLKQAKGRNLNKGDDLEPGEGLISLSSAAHLIMETGKKPQGHWLLEHDEKWGWIYEIEEILISARDGKIIKK